MKLYKEIIMELKKPFPNGTVLNTDKVRAYIPVQAYMKRLEDCAAEQWHWRIDNTYIRQKKLIKLG